MSKEKWQEEADELIDRVLELKDSIKRDTEELGSVKYELCELLQNHNAREYSNKYGKCKFVNFVREGLIKDNVVDAVNSVNKGIIKNIKMNDLTKHIAVSFLNVRGYLND